MKLPVELNKWPDASWRFEPHDPFIEMRKVTLPQDFVADTINEQVVAPSGLRYEIQPSEVGDIRIVALDGSDRRGLYVFDIKRA